MDWMQKIEEKCYKKRHWLIKSEYWKESNPYFGANDDSLTPFFYNPIIQSGDILFALERKAAKGQGEKMKINLPIQTEAWRWDDGLALL